MKENNLPAQLKEQPVIGIEAAEFYKKGAHLYDLDECATALIYFEKAIGCFDENQPQRKKDLAMIWNSKGMVLDSLGRHEEAIECFKEAIKIYKQIDDKSNSTETSNRANPEALYGLALALHNKGYSLGCLEEYEQAIDCFTEAIKRFHESINSFKNKGKDKDAKNALHIHN